jgi:hypothetical protein
MMLTDGGGNHMKDKTTRREPCRRTNAIEPRIRPLVSALNATGLVTTFSSCEGHFGRVDKESLNVRESANVRFEPNAGVREAELEALFGHVIGNHVNSPLMWKALLSIYKEYLPGTESDYVAGHVFVFQIEAFDPHLSSRSKRKHVDLVIEQTAKSVREYVRGLRRRFASLEK